MSESFGKQVERHRGNRKLGVVAGLADITPDHLRLIELDATNPGLLTIHALSVVLDCAWDLNPKTVMPPPTVKERLEKKREKRRKRKKSGATAAAGL